MNSTFNAARSGFIPRLESARGAAALIVAAFHAAQAYWDRDLRLIRSVPEWDEPGWGTAFRLYAALTNGHAAVVFFFVLSGFVLASSLDRDTSRMRDSAWHFFTRRIVRLYPAIGVAILLFAGVYWLTGATLSSSIYYTPLNLLRNVLLFNTEIDGVMWSLQAEVVAIPVIFALVMVERRWGAGPLVVVAAVLVSLSFKPSWNDLVGPTGTALYCFIFGMIVRSAGRAVVSRLGERSSSVAFVVSVVGLFAALPLLGWKFGPIVEAWAAASIVAVLAYRQNVRIARPLDAGLMRFYGRISYSFYLLHPLALIVAWNIPGQLKLLLDAGIPGLVLAFGLFVLSTAAITPLAWISWRFVEQPGIAFGRRITREMPVFRIKLRQAVPAPAPAV